VRTGAGRGPPGNGGEFLNILFIGDIVGRPGRETVRALLGDLIARHQIDFTIANGENLAGGLGITRDTAREVLEAGVEVITTGNHIWRQREAVVLVKEEPRVLRPANYPRECPGRGADVFLTARGTPVGVLNLVGRVFMEPLDCPFIATEEEMKSLHGKTNVVVVDVHAEATSEKLALAWHMDGRASAVLGTHTHVQTGDERILPRGTAYLTDVGMTGPRDSVLGVSVVPVIAHFRTGMPHRFELASGPTVLNAVVVDVDEETGTARSIRRIVEVREHEQQQAT
jgi:metallophosphoesterase (TIGR00282 family)